jgi:hypothetical protein
VLLGVVAVWALVKTVTMNLPSGGWLIAGALVVAGIVGVVTALRPSRR